MVLKFKNLTHFAPRVLAKAELATRQECGPRLYATTRWQATAGMAFLFTSSRRPMTFRNRGRGRH
jgi:hypothetical protein